MVATHEGVSDPREPSKEAAPADQPAGAAVAVADKAVVEGEGERDIGSAWD